MIDLAHVQQARDIRSLHNAFSATHMKGIVIITVIFSKSVYSAQTLFNILHIFYKCLQFSITIHFSLVNTEHNPFKKCFKSLSMAGFKTKQTVRIM